MNEWEEQPDGERAEYAQELGTQDGYADYVQDPDVQDGYDAYAQEPDAQGGYDEDGQGPYADETAYEAEEAVYEQPVYEEPYAPFGEPEPEPARRPVILSTNMTVNLTCTLASMLGVFGLFLCFADKRSHAVRGYAVQSTGLMALFLFASLLLWLLAAVLSWIPLLGWIFAAAVNAARVAAVCADIVLRVQMMLHAYRGEAYVLPVWGERLRAFE